MVFSAEKYLWNIKLIASSYPSIEKGFWKTARYFILNRRIVCLPAVREGRWIVSMDAERRYKSP